MKKLLLFLILVQGMCVAQNPSQLLVQWDLNLTWGGYNPANSYYNNSENTLSAAYITPGNGISMSIDGEGFLSTGWSSNSNAPDFTKYYQFAVTPQAGQNLEPKFFRFQQSGFCKKFQVRYSTSASFPNNGILILQENNAHNNQDEYFNVAFPEGVTVAPGQTLYIRIYGYHRQNGNNWRINSFWNSNWNWFGTNDAPQFYGVLSGSLIAHNDIVTTVQNYPVVADVTANDIAIGTAISGISIVSQPASGTASVQPGNKIAYIPDLNYTGTTSFQYKITSVNGASSIAQVDVNVTPMTGCVANGEEITILKNTTADIEVLSNDITGSGAISTVSISAAPFQGSASVINNIVHYVPQLNYIGTDSFSYSITDVYNNTSTATVTLNIVSPVLPATGDNTGIYCNSSTTWNGESWSNGIPTDEKDVIVTGDYTNSGGSFSACSLFVTGTAQVVFEEESNAFITNNLIISEEASVTFESSCNLIQAANMPNEGNVTFKRFGSRLKRLDYSFWTSPVTGIQTLQEFSPQTLPNRFYTYKTETNDYLAMPSGGTFTTARSYLIRMPDEIFGPQAEAYSSGGYRFAFEGVFTGVPNNGDITIPLQYFDEVNCINGVGNPYPSPISITDFIDENLNNIEGTIWVWRKTNNGDETSYCTITKMGYIANNAPGGGGAGGDDGNNLIADPFSIDEEGVLNTGQGFLVRAKNNQNLVFRNSMRKANNYENFFRNDSSQQTPPSSGNGVVASRIWLNLTNINSSVFSQTLIGYTNGATLDYDNGLDAKSSLSGAVSLYSVIENAQLAIQARPPFTTDDIVPLGFKTLSAGQYVIMIDHVNGLFLSEQAIYLKDNDTGILHDIKAGEYTFDSDAGTFDSRFEIVYFNEAELSQEIEPVVKDSMIYSEGQKIKIKCGDEIGSVTVYDVLGRTLYSTDKILDVTYTTPELTAQQHVVIVKVLFTNSKELTRKLILGI